MNKIATAIGGLLMIGAVLAPLAAAHKDSGAHNTAVALPVPAGWAAGVKGSPAGFYYGAAAAWAQLTANSAGTGPAIPGCPAPTGNPTVDPIVCAFSALDLNPSFTLAAANALCDMEVAGDGSTPEPVDEKVVDGTTDSGALPFAAELPDGTFDDGGIGAACHTNKDFYAYTPYNTPGCSGASVKAFAADESGLVPWVSTSCDSTSPTVQDGLLTQVLSAESCAVNDVISGNPLDAPSCVVRLTDCLGLTTSGTCTTTGGVSCGVDGVADAGAGSNGFGDSAHGVPYGSVAAGCTDASEAAFVWNAVQIDTTGGANHESAATVGWIN